ncbi:MarR family winged helix-turn-helix transcriptional regulator [Leucobacter aridicollis]|uniref:MarR family winged helix-turn-helix transcriptional regulator n=1 Tax=Leucobacter aridicollis TaxID=283878 RepID=UPI0021047E88|nr:MarR family transcriptional regulator [Leucobacter aridicollis]UTX53936.1 MarR family transcriptional regulator [Leucobacter aridicollis]
MQDKFTGEEQDRSNVYDLDSNDPEQRLVSRTGVDPAQVQHIGMLMGALGRLRDAEQELSDASLKYMRLNETDMRALHFLIVAGNRGDLATPGTIASHLKISSASTTKLLDRLERAGHIVRRAHPTDRRALAISITPETHEAAMNTVGKQHAKRFHAAARLTPAERDVVIRFLDDMASEIRIGSDEWPNQDEAGAN